VLVADELPAGLALVPDGATGEGWVCGVLGRVVTCARPSLAALATAPVIRLEVQVDPGFQQRRIDNEAVVSSSTTDIDLSNNRSTAGFDVTFSADLELTKTHDPDVPVVAGQPVTFDLVVRNDGPSDAQAPIVVRDTLPPGLSYLAAGSLWSCTTSGTPAVDQQVECILNGDEPLRAGTAAPVLTLTVQVGADVAAGELVNRAAVSSSTPDPKPGNNTDTDPIIVTTMADLVVAKSHAGPVRVGGALAFGVVVTNAGPSEARDVMVTDVLPDGLTFVSAAGTDWTCTSPAGQVRCELAGPLAPGASAPPVTVTATVEPTAFPGVENVVDVTTSTPETTTDNNRATDRVVVPPLVDLAINKSHAGSFTVGQQGTYTLAVTNAGPTPDPGPQTITDTLPTGLSFVSAAGPGWACSAAGATVTCVREAVLQVGASAAVSLVVAVGPEAAPSAVNTASVSTPSSETTTANNTDADPTVVIPVSVLTIDKSVADLDGDLVTYLVVVANTGPNATSAPIVVVDPLLEGLSFVSVAGSGWACSEGRTVTCTFAAPLPVGGEAAFELVARLVADPGVTVRNVASIIDGESTVVTDDAVVTSPTEGGGSGGGAGSGGLADSGADMARQLALALLLLVLGAAAVQRAHRLG
jgi:uncharacterized repeat protein (TIGR01451 family)